MAVKRGSICTVHARMAVAVLPLIIIIKTGRDIHAVYSYQPSYR